MKMNILRNLIFACFIIVMILASSLIAKPSSSAPALPAPSGTIVNVSTETALVNAVLGISSNTTIVIAAGTYNLTNTLHITGGVTNVSLRGATGNRDDVIIAGKGMSVSSYGNVPHCILVSDAQNVLIADLTLHDAWYHNVQIAGNSGADEVHLYNLHLYDSGEQQVKVSSGGADYCENCTVIDNVFNDVHNPVEDFGVGNRVTLI